MNVDEEIFLTAYLDDELHPELRLGVDSALLSNPALVEDLRDLSAVRDLVAGLARPAPAVVLSVAVLCTILRRSDAGPLSRVIGLTAANWSARAVALVSAAAALVASASIGLPGPAPGNPDIVLRRADGSRIGVPALPPAHVAPIETARAQAEGNAAVAADAGRLDLTGDDRRREQEAQEIRALLESPKLRKILIVTDIVGGDAGRQVEDLIDKTPRRSATYGRFTVSQGIIIDPEHPGEATVFAVVMDDLELRQFRTRLNESFPESIKETEAGPEVVTQLAEVGQVSIYPGTTVASVYVPEGPVPALKSEPGKRPEGMSLLPVHPGVDPLDVPIISENFTDRPVATPRPRRSIPPPVRRPQYDSSVVLVWVATPRRDGPGMP